MKKNVLIFGGILGLIMTGVAQYMAVRCYHNPEHTSNDVVGYAGLLLVLSIIFVGIRNYRDKYNGGFISFGKAFKLGLYISLVAASMYTVVWLINYYLFIPDFEHQYVKHVMYMAKQNGATAAELTQKTKEMAEFTKMYQNPLFVTLQTFSEVLLPSLPVILISALILKRKPKMVL